MPGQRQSDIAICNAAISKVGGARIVDFNGNTKESNLCSDIYEQIRDQVLTASDWSFARVRRSLTPLAAQPLSGYQYQYAVPAEDLVVRNVYQDARHEHELHSWDVESTDDDTIVIVANPVSGETLYTRHTRRFVASEKFSPAFVSALTARLAAEMAIPVAQSRALKRDMWAEYEAKLMDATSTDGQQGRTQGVTASTLIRVRGRGGPWVYGPPVPGA